MPDDARLPYWPPVPRQEMAAADRIRPATVAKMTSLSVRKVQELSAAGKIPGAVLSDDGWSYCEHTVHRWIKRMERIAYKGPAMPPTLPTGLNEANIVAAAKRRNVKKIGVYFLIRAGKVIYVGQSRDIDTRLLAHARTRRFNAWHWIACKRWDLNALERHYLNILMPPGNKDAATLARKAKQRRGGKYD